MAAAANQGVLGREVGVRSELGQAGREIQDVISTAEPVGLGVMTLSLGGGAIASQEISDAVREAAGMPVAPQSMRGFTADAGIKTTFGLLIAALSRRLTGFPMVLAIVAAVGALSNAGVAGFNALQRSGFLAEAPVTVQSVQANGSGRTKPAREGAEAGGIWD